LLPRYWANRFIIFWRFCLHQLSDKVTTQQVYLFSSGNDVNTLTKQWISYLWFTVLFCQEHSIKMTLQLTFLPKLSLSSVYLCFYLSCKCCCFPSQGQCLSEKQCPCHTTHVHVTWKTNGKSADLLLEYETSWQKQADNLKKKMNMEWDVFNVLKVCSSLW